MKKLVLYSLLLVSLLFSCKKEKVLQEVQLPDPNAVEEVIYPNPADVKTNEKPFEMNGLAYQYNDLEPYIDAKTMEIHYSKHHVGYANKLNTAIKDSEFKTNTIEEILNKLDVNNSFLRNNAGGYYNHNLFFEILSPKKGTKPSNTFGEAIIRDFGSFSSMNAEISEASTSLFGSGWVWLIVDKDGKLKVSQTINQDNPLMSNAVDKGTPILAIDIWEHAYYLKYQNNRTEYIEGLFNIINWEIVSKKYDNSIAMKL
ncbi:MAG: Fe-Mn family superoxide dismutase [Flavobacterium sp.]|jgi:Fe-Mn family superoxide dismutase